MAGKSSWLETAQLKTSLQNTAQAALANVYVSAHTADPADTGANEVTGGSYARVTCSCGTSGTGVGAVFSGAPTVAAGTQSTNKSTLTNSSAITFPTATASWGTVTYVALWDALTVGHLLWSGALSSGVAVGIGGQLTIPTGSLQVFED